MVNSKGMYAKVHFFEQKQIIFYWEELGIIYIAQYVVIFEYF